MAQVLIQLERPAFVTPELRAWINHLGPGRVVLSRGRGSCRECDERRGKCGQRCCNRKAQNRSPPTEFRRAKKSGVRPGQNRAIESGMLADVREDRARISNGRRSWSEIRRFSLRIACRSTRGDVTARHQMSVRDFLDVDRRAPHPFGATSLVARSVQPHARSVQFFFLPSPLAGERLGVRGFPSGPRIARHDLDQATTTTARPENSFPREHVGNRLCSSCLGSIAGIAL